MRVGLVLDGQHVAEEFLVGCAKGQVADARFGEFLNCLLAVFGGGFVHGQMHGEEDVRREDEVDGLPGVRVLGMQDEQDVVEAGLQKGVEVFFVRERRAVGEQAADLAEFFGVRDQVGQVVAQGGFAAREGDVRDARLPSFVENGTPFVGGQLAGDAFRRGHVGLCPAGDAVGEGAV